MRARQLLVRIISGLQAQESAPFTLHFLHCGIVADEHDDHDQNHGRVCAKMKDSMCYGGCAE